MFFLNASKYIIVSIPITERKKCDGEYWITGVVAIDLFGLNKCIEQEVIIIIDNYLKVIKFILCKTYKY